jgi:hypothetical protein
MSKPRNVIEAPRDGYSLVVDGHFKSHYTTIEAAQQAALALKSHYRMLQVQVYDAASKTRSLIGSPV